MNKHVSQRLKEGREYLGYSVDEIAHLMEIDDSLLTRIEDASADISEADLDRLAAFYGLSKTWLLNGGDIHPKVQFLARAKVGLSAKDLGEVNRFASYLQNSNKGSR